MGGGADPHGPGRAAGLIGEGNGGGLAPFEPGSVVTLRETWQGRLTALRSVRVVEDVPHHHQAFYLAPGSRWLNDPRHMGEVRFLDPRTGRVMVFAAIDNLWKGAAGQAVQNLNLMLGADETAGLR